MKNVHVFPVEVLSITVGGIEFPLEPLILQPRNGVQRERFETVTTQLNNHVDTRLLRTDLRIRYRLLGGSKIHEDTIKGWSTDGDPIDEVLQANQLRRTFIIEILRG